MNTLLGIMGVLGLLVAAITFLGIILSFVVKKIKPFKKTLFISLAISLIVSIVGFSNYKISEEDKQRMAKETEMKKKEEAKKEEEKKAEKIKKEQEKKKEEEEKKQKAEEKKQKEMEEKKKAEEQAEAKKQVAEQKKKEKEEKQKAEKEAKENAEATEKEKLKKEEEQKQVEKLEKEKASKEKGLEDKIKKVVNKKFGKDKVESIEINDNLGTEDPNDKIVLITTEGKQNLTNKMTKKGMWIDTIDILKDLSKEKEISEIAFFYKYPMVDAYGGEKKDTVMKITLNRETLDKINFDNFLHDNLPKIANQYWEHPAFNKK